MDIASILTDLDVFEAVLPGGRTVPMRLVTAAETAALRLMHPAPPEGPDGEETAERQAWRYGDMFLRVMIACGHEPEDDRGPIGRFDPAGYRDLPPPGAAVTRTPAAVGDARDRRRRWVRATLAMMERFPVDWVYLLDSQLAMGRAHAVVGDGPGKSGAGAGTATTDGAGGPDASPG